MGGSNKFWMVWMDSGSSPTRKHPDIESARREAARLATKAGASHAYVLEAMEVIEPVYSMSVKPLTDADEG